MWHIRPALSVTLTILTYVGVLLSFSLLAYSPLLALIVFLLTTYIAKDNDVEASEFVVTAVIWIIVLYAAFSLCEWLLLLIRG